MPAAGMKSVPTTHMLKLSKLGACVSVCPLYSGQAEWFPRDAKVLSGAVNNYCCNYISVTKGEHWNLSSEIDLNERRALKTGLGVNLTIQVELYKHRAELTSVLIRTTKYSVARP